MLGSSEIRAPDTDQRREAIAARDAESAGRLMDEHVAHGEGRIVPALRAAGYE